MRASYVQDGNLKQQYLDEYKLAMETLAGVREGTTKLAYTNGAEVPSRTTRYLSSTENYSHIFNMDDPGSWRVDDDQVSDMTDARS